MIDEIINSINDYEKEQHLKIKNRIDNFNEAEKELYDDITYWIELLDDYDEDESKWWTDKLNNTILYSFDLPHGLININDKLILEFYKEYNIDLTAGER